MAAESVGERRGQEGVEEEAQRAERQRGGVSGLVRRRIHLVARAAEARRGRLVDAAGRQLLPLRGHAQAVEHRVLAQRGAGEHHRVAC